PTTSASLSKIIREVECEGSVTCLLFCPSPRLRVSACDTYCSPLFLANRSIARSSPPPLGKACNLNSASPPPIWSARNLRALRHWCQPTRKLFQRPGAHAERRRCSDQDSLSLSASGARKPPALAAAEFHVRS